MNPKDLVGAKKAPLRYVPPAVVIEAAGPMEDGALKYGPMNWREKPVELVTYLEAIGRHLLALIDGQDLAEDSGHSHIGHIIAGAGIIADAKAYGTLIDNRFHAGPAADMLRALDKSVKAVIKYEERSLTEDEQDQVRRVALGQVRFEHLPEPGVKFLCGHSFGQEPLSDCGTAIHWSRVNGIERRPSDNEGLGDICADQGHHLPGLHNLSCPEFA